MSDKEHMIARVKELEEAIRYITDKLLVHEGVHPTYYMDTYRPEDGEYYVTQERIKRLIKSIAA